MRSLLIVPFLAFATVPAAACDLDYLPDFAGHSYQIGMDAEEAARAKEEAMARARASFIRQYGLAQAEGATANGTATTVADASTASTAPTAP